MPNLQRLVIAPEQRHRQELQLTPKQLHYLYRVLRLQPGDRFIALDRGQWWLTELQDETLPAQLLEMMPVQTELLVPVTLIAALPKGNGFDSVITQATELGVTKIQPILSERTLLQPSTHKLERWQRLAKEAAEQSLRQVVPEICAPISFQMGLQTVAPGCLHNYICVLDANAPHLTQALNQHPPSPITLVTGPEGGWTAAEQDLAIALGFSPVSLGARILRAVTAPLAALAIVAAHLEGGIKMPAP